MISKRRQCQGGVRDRWKVKCKRSFWKKTPKRGHKAKSTSSESYSAVSDSCDPMDCSLPGSSVHGFSRQEYWSGLLFPSPGDLPDPGIELMFPALQADSLPTELKGNPKVQVEVPKATHLR